MFIGTHETIAKNVYLTLATEKNVYLNRNLFIFGNVFPDLHVDYIKQKHYKNLCYDKIKSAIIEISNTKMTLAEFSFKAGIICHYVSDFFCYPHEQEWRYLQGNTKEHIQFENKQNIATRNKIFIAKTDIELKDIEDAYIDFFIENLLDEYRNSIDYSRDVLYAVTVSYHCVEKMLFNMFKKNIIEFKR